MDIKLINVNINKHISVQKDGLIFVHRKLTEDPLGLTEKEHYGSLGFELGTHVGPDGRYGWRISRKLGWESSASIWLAFDEQHAF